MSPVRTKEQWLEILEGVTHCIVPEFGKAGIYDSGWAMMNRLESLGLWGNGSRILEIGTGNGRMAIPLADRDVSYLGIEPIPECAAFCKRAFEGYPHLTFEHVDFLNGYYRETGSVDPLEYVFPAESGQIDLVIFHSIFTHVGILEICAHYLNEAWRVLRPGGKCWMTWFRSPPNEVTSEPVRTVFCESDIMNLVSRFKIFYTANGLTDGFHDQWEMAVER